MKFDPKSGELIPFQRKTVFNPKKGMIEEVPVLPKGEAGMVGPIGPIGPKGDKGDQGERGEKGERGDIGPVGPQGNEGPRGPTGMVGPTGPTGPRGEKGEKGDSIPLEEYPIIHKTALKPKDSFGKNGDWAFTDTNEIYFKKNNMWIFYQSIGGPSAAWLLSRVREEISNASGRHAGYYQVTGGQVVNVDESKEMHVFNIMSVDGTINIEGKLIIL